MYTTVLAHGGWLCPQDIAIVLGFLPMFWYVKMKAKHIWHWFRHRGSPKDDGCCDGHDHR